MSSRLKKVLLLASFCQMAAISERYGAMNRKGVFGVPEYRTKTGNTLADGKPRKQQPKQLHEFRIKGLPLWHTAVRMRLRNLKRKGSYDTGRNQ